MAGSSWLTFIYYFDSETWETGVEYPDKASAYGYSVPYQNTFLTGDGDHSDGTIYKYNAATNNWDEVITAETEHYFGTGLLIPDDFYSHCGDELVRILR